MKELVIGRNKAKDTLIFAPMLFITIGGIYLLSEGRSTNFYLALMCTLIGSLVCAYFIVAWIKNAPVIRLSDDGVYLEKLKRNIPWKSIAFMKVVEKSDEEHEDRNTTPRKHLVVFEITETKPEGNFGVEHWQSILYADIEVDFNRRVKEHLEYYKSK